MLKDLTPSDKVELMIVLLAMLGCTVLVVSIVAWSNGKDVDYFKERVIMLDNRMNVLDKRVHDSVLRQEEVVKKMNETVTQLNSVTTKVEEHDKWLDEWKKLPSLPKPKERR
mgnify:CR=1 FL=1|jgi:hypothetical protein